jgi:hypothetical protein
MLKMTFIPLTAFVGAVVWMIVRGFQEKKKFLSRTPGDQRTNVNGSRVANVVGSEGSSQGQAHEVTEALAGSSDQKMPLGFRQGRI